MPYHLPVLLNPLVNAVFNCPNPSTSNLKKLFARLKDQKFILLVPPCGKLLNYKDKLSGLPLQELCYSFDFVASHVLLIDDSSGENVGISSLNQVQFETANRKKVLVRSQHRFVLTTDGFQFKKKCRITDINFIANFNDYLLPLDQFPVIYIDEPLCGELVKIHPTQEEAQNGLKRERKEDPLVTPEAPLKNKNAFENILRLHPTWTNNFSELFAEYRNTSEKSGPHPELFHDIVSRVCSSMSNEEPFKALPDLFDLVYEYVELNLFDDIWVRTTNHLRGSEVNTEALRDLALYQLGTDLYTVKFQKFQLANVVSLEKSIVLATDSFSRISPAHGHDEKSDALIETLQILSKENTGDDKLNSSMAMDADMLLSLFVLVVCRAQVKNLKAQLFYLQHFARDASSIKYGVLGYATSTLEAVVYHFEDLRKSGRMTEIEKECRSNRAMVDSLLIPAEISFDFQRFQESLRYRTALGESVLSLCIANNKTRTLLELLGHDHEFPLEDLLEDETTDGCTLFIQALRRGNNDAANIIADIMISSCTQQELLGYFNRFDRQNRTAAHYLTHEVEILQKIGRFIKWDAKDLNGHTALFTIFRSYDQPNYEQMVQASFACAADWYRSKNMSFDFRTHEDRKGNTLLHIMKRGISMLLKFETVDLNASNLKGLTPLMVYSKYNRVDNIKAILNDNRVMINKVQYPLLLDSLCYAKNPLVLHELAKHAAMFTAGKCYAHTMRYEASSWLIDITSQVRQKYQTTEFRLKTLQNFFRTFLKMNPMTFLPLDSALELLSSLGRTKLSTITRLETMSFLRNVTNCLNALILVANLPEDIVSSEAALVSWIKSQMKANKNANYRYLYNKKVEPEEMSIIQSFLRFNQHELSTLKTKLQVMKKLAIFLRLKSKDVVESSQLYFSQSAENLEDIDQLTTRRDFNCRVYGDGPMVILAEEISFLLTCTIRLQTHISTLLQVRIPDWWRLYGESVSLHQQYCQNFPHLVRDDSSLIETGILGRLLEGKKEKLEKKLSFSIAETRRSMNEAGADIAHLHEDLAEQLSKFMDYKGAFFSHVVMKKWAIENIKALKDQLLHLERVSEGPPL